MTHQLNRRNVLAAGAAAAGAATVAACSGNQGGGQNSAETPTVAPDTELAALGDIPVGQSITAKTPDGQDIIVSRPTQGSAKAFSATCTHQGCKVAPQGGELHCPCHGSTFDPKTGEARNGPAEAPLPAVPVRVSNGKITSGWQ